MVAEGITIVVSTSYLDEAERCDRVALLNEGRLLALDTPNALQASISGRMLAIHADQPRPTRDLLRDEPFVQSAHLFGDAVHVLVDDGTSDEEALAPVRSAGLGVREYEVTAPSLEDVFMGLVG